MIVMSAIKKAISVSPWGKRAMELLDIAVGTQPISPLYWFIKSRSLMVAKAMITDLTTIRADRDSYYYGWGELYTRHPKVVQRLCAGAAGPLPTLLDGLIWRSKVTVDAQQRVNYYLRHVIQDSDGKFNKALEWLVEGGDPKTVCYPVVVLRTLSPTMLRIRACGEPEQWQQADGLLAKSRSVHVLRTLSSTNAAIQCLWHLVSWQNRMAYMYPGRYHPQC